MATYRSRDLLIAGGKTERFWSCSECGALVGPGSNAKNAHERFHSKR